MLRLVSAAAMLLALVAADCASKYESCVRDTGASLLDDAIKTPSGLVFWCSEQTESVWPCVRDAFLGSEPDGTEQGRRLREDEVGEWCQEQKGAAFDKNSAVGRAVTAYGRLCRIHFAMLFHLYLDAGDPEFPKDGDPKKALDDCFKTKVAACVGRDEDLAECVRPCPDLYALAGAANPDTSNGNPKMNENTAGAIFLAAIQIALL